jgi:hypothetical protein
MPGIPQGFSAGGLIVARLGDIGDVSGGTWRDPPARGMGTMEFKLGMGGICRSLLIFEQDEKDAVKIKIGLAFYTVP